MSDIDWSKAHADDLAVDAFARAMRDRLAACRAASRSGWDDPEQCPPQRLAEGLVRAVRAGKLVDVGNYAMMLWKRADQAQAMARACRAGSVKRWSVASRSSGTVRACHQWARCASSTPSTTGGWL